MSGITQPGSHLRRQLLEFLILPVNDRIAKREEVLEMLTHLMQDGQPSDTPKIRAAELLGKHHGIFSERVVIEPPEKTSEELAGGDQSVTESSRKPLGCPEAMDRRYLTNGI